MSSVWEDAGLALVRAHFVVTAEDLKALSSIPSHKVVSCHIHKLVQVRLFIFGCVTHRVGWLLMFITLLFLWFLGARRGNPHIL